MNCESCLNSSICKYVEDWTKIKITSDNPYLEIHCVKYCSKNAKEYADKLDVQSVILRWRTENPTKRKIDCNRELGISRPTIDKYWDIMPIEKEIE